MSRVILFGAGASYGSPSILPNRPPLGFGLYEELSEMFPQSWGNLPISLAAEFAGDFETGMGNLWKSGSHAIPDLMQHMAIYFARFNLQRDRTDSYSLFIERLVEVDKLEDAIFSTLNYECLFEIAVCLSGKNVNYLSEHSTSEGVVTVWKLHGSCNFLPGERVRLKRAASFSPGATFNPGILPVNPSDVAPYCYGNTALYPIMSVYTRGKPVQISPSVIDTLRNWWKDSVESAESVAVIGVNPHPIDEHIWVPLATTNASVSFVGNEGAINAWIEESRDARPSRFIGLRFHDHIDDLVKAI